MKTNLSLALMLSIFLLGSSCVPFKTIKGDGNLVTKEISVTAYEKIKAYGGSMVFDYSQSEATPYLKITTDQNVYEMYDLKVVEGELQILPKQEFRNANFRPTQFTVHTNSAQLSRIDLSGSAEFNINGLFTAESMKIDLAGSGTINLKDSARINKTEVDMAGSATLNAANLTGTYLEGDIAGSGEFNLNGEMERVSFSMAGSGTVNAFGMQVVDMDCDIAGSGRVDISVSKSIRAEIAGSGKVRYKGNPEHIQKEVAGVGSITQMDN